MVAKKKAKKAKKKTAKKKAARRRRTITIKCTGGFCIASPRELNKVHVGDTVVFKAIGTGVNVSFRKSPFKVMKFRLESGTQKALLVVNGPGTFNYRKKCDDCPNPMLPPRIIVE